ADIQQFVFSVVGQAIPGGAAAAHAPVVFYRPRFGRGLQVRLVLRPQFRIPRNGIEAPLEGATVQSEGGQRAPCALEISATISDDDRVASYRWRTRHEIEIGRASCR